MNHPGIRLCAAVVALSAAAGTPAAGTVAATPSDNTGSDCSAAYGAAAASCHVAPCPDAYAEFLGVWSGQFQAYVRELSRPGNPVFRPYEDTVTYTAADCLANTQAGETLIVGHRQDRYPAFQGLPARQDSGLLIMGSKSDGTRFLRTVEHGELTQFVLSYSNRAADMSVWSAQVPGSGGRPPMSITTIDARDPEAAAVNKRDVIVTMSLGPESQPLWNGIIAHGSHTKRP